jgi:hypothetical protein
MRLQQFRILLRVDVLVALQVPLPCLLRITRSLAFLFERGFQPANVRNVGIQPILVAVLHVQRPDRFVQSFQ